MKIYHKILSWLERDTKWPSYLTVLLVFLVSALIFSAFGFEGTLVRDDAIILYGGQQLAEGVPPYISIFDNKTPMAPFLSGMGVLIATLLNLDDILVVRITFLTFCSLAAVGLYLLGSTLFRSQKVGILTSFIFVGYSGFGIHAASGPREKALMVTFVVFSLLLTTRKKWFWAGIFSSIALLTWQYAAVYALIAVILAVLQSERGQPQVRNAMFTILGVLTPIAVVSLYFLYKGAFYDFVDGTILFNLFYLERTSHPLLEHILRPIEFVNIGFRSMALPIFIGFFMVLLMYMWRIRLYRSSLVMLIHKDPFSALLLSFPAVVIWTVVDFQHYPDLFIFLPYVALGFGWLLYRALHGLPRIKGIGTTMQKLCFFVLCALLLGSAALNYLVISENGLEEQRQWARQIESQFGTETKLLAIGAPEVLVLLHRTNPNPYVFVTSGIDNKIDATTPGGFAGWLEELERYDPDVIVTGRTKGKFAPMLTGWLQSNYREIKVGQLGTWKLFVKHHP